MNLRPPSAPFAAALLLCLALGGPAAAQLLGAPLQGGGGLIPDLKAPSIRLDTPLGKIDTANLADLREVRLRDLVRANPRDLALDPRGAPFIRDEIVATAITPQALERVRAAGFRLVRSEPLESLGLTIAVLAPPQGLGASEALRRLRRLDPEGEYDFNHVYFGAGAAAPAPGPQPPRRAGEATAMTPVGMIDTGVDTSRLGLPGVRIEQRGFAPGGVRPAAHGAAVASLIAGPGVSLETRLYIADVYGPGPRGGSAEAVVRAFAWLLESRVGVINVSLVGPSNGALKAAVEASLGRGAVVVAAVGNDGPAAPPAYPASYPGVVAVTGVDARDRVLPEAGRAAHIDFAAPGADILAADGSGRMAPVRGTSFAAPLVARRLAQLRTGLSGAAAVEALARQARDLGAKGPDKVFGRGLVGEEVRLAARR